MAMVADFPTPPPDPREQPVEQPYYPQFQRELAATEQARVLAMYLMHVHYLFEGWGNPPQTPTATLLAYYTKAAQLSVRYSSEAYRATAYTLAANYAENALEELQGRLRSCALDREQRAQLVRDFAGKIVSVFLHHLVVGCGRHPEEWRVFDRDDTSECEEEQ